MSVYLINLDIIFFAPFQSKAQQKKEKCKDWSFVSKIVLWEKIVLVIEKNFWNSRLKAENFQNFWDHWNNLFKQWKVRSILNDEGWPQRSRAWRYLTIRRNEESGVDPNYCLIINGFAIFVLCLQSDVAPRSVQRIMKSSLVRLCLL